jgi:type VI secretion system protein ImpM
VTSAGLTGFHGKFPARGDFVTRNLPRSFLTPWDDWLQAGLAASRDQLGEGWLSVYLESPIWRFVLAPGVCGPESWAGVLMPSVDRVGRYFPLTIAEPLDPSAHPLVTAVAAAAWFESAEALAVRALEDDRLDLEGFVGDVAGLATAPSLATAIVPTVVSGSDAAGWCVDLETASTVGMGLTIVLDALLIERGGSYTAWWTNGGAQVPGHCCVLPRLPPVDRFHHLLTGTMAPTPAHGE